MVKEEKTLLNTEKKITRLTPKSLVHNFYNKISVQTAGLVILFSVIIEIILLLFLGFPDLGKYFLLRLADVYIFSWLIVGLVLYLLVYLVRGKSKVESNAFSKILSGLASFKIISIFVMLLSSIITMIFVPKIVPFIKVIFSNPLLAYSSSVMPVLSGLNVFGIILLSVLMIVMFIYYIFMLYYLVKEMYKYKSFFPNFILGLVILIFMALLSFLL